MNEYRLTLLPNLQFIYELHMAQLEVKTLAKGVQLQPDFLLFSAK